MSMIRPLAILTNPAKAGATLLIALFVALLTGCTNPACGHPACHPTHGRPRVAGYSKTSGPAQPCDRRLHSSGGRCVHRTRRRRRRAWSLPPAQRPDLRSMGVLSARVWIHPG